MGFALLLIRGSPVQVGKGDLDNQGFRKVKLLKPFFLAKNLQKLNENK